MFLQTNLMTEIKGICSACALGLGAPSEEHCNLIKSEEFPQLFVSFVI
jgi:hypothetical protein